MAAIWKGAINFGLINVPVKLTTATQKQGVVFRTLHEECGTPINQKRYCPECEKEIDYKETVKGFELEDGEFLRVSEELLKKIPLKSLKYIQIMSFIDIANVDPVYFEKSYFLSPETAGEKPYLILYNAMKETNSAAVSKISIRDKERLCIVRIYEDGLMLNTMFFADEVRSNVESSTAKIADKIAVSKAENDLAIQIVKNLTEDFKPQKYHDEYYESLLSLLSSEADGKDGKKARTEKIPTAKATLDLFEKLRASVEATMKEGGGKSKKTTKKAPPVPPTKGKNNSTNAHLGS